MDSLSNVVLIGLPTAGKSTLGRCLADQFARVFIDTDDLIEAYADKSCQQIADQDGYQRLREIEERVILDLDVQSSVIATGGSAVYSQAAIDHLKARGVIVYLSISLETLKRRLPEPEFRGLAEPKGITIEQLVQNRKGLYDEVANLTILGDDLSQDQALNLLVAELQANKHLTLGAS